MNNFGSLHTDSRTAGFTNNQYKSVQSWKTPKNLPAGGSDQAQRTIMAGLEKAAIGKVGRHDVEIKQLSAYAAENGPKSTSKEFKFLDVVDVVNPLQHLPIVNMVYREMTGDQLHPVSQIIGGAIYGGPIGAVTGTVNAVSKMQTGKDLGEHVMGFAGLNTNKMMNFNSPADPQVAINAYQKAQSTVEAVEDTPISLNNLQPRENISAVSLKAMPSRHNS